MLNLSELSYPHSWWSLISVRSTGPRRWCNFCVLFLGLLIAIPLTSKWASPAPLWLQFGFTCSPAPPAEAAQDFIPTVVPGTVGPSLLGPAPSHRAGKGCVHGEQCWQKTFCP